MSYTINGPTLIGDTGELNEILGTLQLSDVCTATGDIIYSSNANGLMTRRAIGTAGQVLTVVGGVPDWATPTTIEEGFSARKTGTQVLTIPFTDAVVTNWSTGTAPEYDTTGGDFNSTTGVYTASLAGTVNVRAGISLLSNRNNGTRSLSIRYNGTNSFTMTAQPSANNSIPTFLHASTNLNLAATDTVDIVINSSANGGTSTVQASPNSWFSISKNFTP